MRRINGFTLLEVMVVIVIIGVLVTVTTIAVGVLGKDREVEDEARRFAAILTQAKEEAELQGRDIGVMVNRRGYEFFIFDIRKQAWVAPDDDFYAARQFPEGLETRLWMDDREVVLTQDAQPDKAKEQSDESSKDSDESAEQSSDQSSGQAFGQTFGLGLVKSGPEPQITLLSSGEVNDFELRIEREGTDHIWRVASKSDFTLEAEEFSDAPAP